MNRLNLQLEYSNQALKFSAFFANDEILEFGSPFTGNCTEGINALSYLCVREALHQESGLKGRCTLSSQDPNCKKLAKAITNKPMWLTEICSYFPKGKILENKGVSREPRVSFSDDIEVLVEVISSKSVIKARYSELELFKNQMASKPYVTSLSVEILPCQGGSRKIIQHSEKKGGVFQGDLLWIRGVINCNAHFILIWVDGNGDINVLYPEIFLQIPATIEYGEQKSSILFPSKNGMGISSVKGHEICMLVFSSEIPDEKNVKKVVSAFKKGIKQTRKIWSLESNFIYSASRNMNSLKCDLPTANELGLTFENGDRNPASALLEHISIDAISARVIIMPNLTNYRDRD